MITIPEITFRMHKFELKCLVDQLEWSDRWRVEITLKDKYPDQIEFTNEWVAILTREEDLPF